MKNWRDRMKLEILDKKIILNGITYVPEKKGSDLK